MNPRASFPAIRADSGPAPSPIGRAAPIPTAPGTAQTSLLDLSPSATASTTAGASASAGLSPVAALFIQEDGCYYDLPGVDPWPEARDARTYAGPWPVVAHPPCQRWGNLAAVNYARWGGEHNRPGNDGGCFAAALKAVKTYGGVLEHPRGSKAFSAHRIAEPVGTGWQRTLDGWVCEVWQSAYGHRANKATWLFYVGDFPPAPLNWRRVVGTHQVGQRDQRGKSRNKPTLSSKEAAATPLAFRDALIGLARMSRVRPLQPPF